MNLIEFKTFLTVIEEKGITAAAEKLNITQQQKNCLMVTSTKICLITKHF